MKHGTYTAPSKAGLTEPEKIFSALDIINQDALLAAM